MSDYKTQAERILKLLLANAPNWVSLPDILDLRIASHTRRIHELRKWGHKIEIKDEWIFGERHTAYRIARP